jgi:two-component system, OmpR family, alkaline phosphatase synthesis response regulator PhoP
MTASLSKKTLIVDDEAYIRLLINQILEDLEDDGLQVFQADNGADALRLVKEHRPDMIFLDVMIPKINGFEVCRIIKRELKFEDVFVVILTAKGQEYDRKTAEDVGTNNYMTKPFDPDELLDLVVKVLGINGTHNA